MTPLLDGEAEVVTGVASVVCFPASELSGFVTAESITIDGGVTNTA